MSSLTTLLPRRYIRCGRWRDAQPYPAVPASLPRAGLPDLLVGVLAGEAMSDTPNLDRLLTPAEAAELRRREWGFGKGPTRLQDRTAEDRETEKKDEKFRRDIYRLDKGLCRCCGRKVERKIDRVMDRAEIHHVHGRTGDLRFDLRNGLCLCCACHERVTGKVNDRLQIVGTKFYRLDKQRLINARATVRFEKVA